MLVAGLAAAPGAHAHEVGLSRGTWVLRALDEGSPSKLELQMELTLARKEALSLCPALDVNADRAIDEGELVAAKAAIASCVLDDIEVASGRLCTGAVEGASLTEEDGFAVRAVFRCEHGGRTTVDLSKLLGRTASGHRHLGRVATASSEHDVVAFAGRPAFSFGEEAPAAPPVAAYLWIGVEHILLGFDHLVFLLGLVIIGGRLRSLLFVVTAFTAAHSVSLALAVLGVVVPSGAVIEPLIALSIVYVGVENFVVKDADSRWRITAPFGFIHGFGFAGALAEVGVPPDAVAPALFLFNMGVELGQVAVLVVVLPVVWFAQRRAPRGFVRAGRVLSAGIVVLGVFWFVERVFL